MTGHRSWAHGGHACWDFSCGCWLLGMVLALVPVGRARRVRGLVQVEFHLRR